VKRALALAAAIGLAVAACSVTPAPERTQLWSGLNLLAISEQVERDVAGVDCRPPGGGGGSAGAGPNGGSLAHHHAAITCDYQVGDGTELADAWGPAATSYLGSIGITVTVPGSFTGDAGRGFTWEYAAAGATGVLTITIVPIGDGSVRVLGNVTEFNPKG
jgi:hypothetical protein